MNGVFSALGGTGYKSGSPIDISGIAFTIELSLAFKVDDNDPNTKNLKIPNPKNPKTQMQKSI